MLKDTGAKGFTTNFNDLGDFDQIPGLASQRLMAEGYGFGAEGDWKTAALYRTTWFMSQGMPNGVLSLKIITLNFDGEKTPLQAHMLEVCPLIAEQKPKLEVHRLKHWYRQQNSTPRIHQQTRQRRSRNYRRLGQPLPPHRKQSGMHQE